MKKAVAVNSEQVVIGNEESIGAISTCMECGTLVTDQVNGWVELMEEENHTECLCDACHNKELATFGYICHCGIKVSKDNQFFKNVGECEYCHFVG